LVKLNEVTDWDTFNDLPVHVYKDMGKTGRPPYPPVALLNDGGHSLSISLLRTQMEKATDYHLAISEFVGLGVTEAAPDHSTLSDFKARLRETGGWDHFEAIADGTVRQALAAGIRLDKIQVVDSVHRVADVDSDADRLRQEHGKPSFAVILESPLWLH
jgi:hypothetical protein